MKMKKANQLLLIFFFVLMQIIANAQTDIKALEKYISQARADWGVPGMAVAIVQNGKVLSSRGYGYLEQGKRDKVDENTLFAIASNTKAFVASSIGVLAESGKLKLEDKVHGYIPEFQMYDPYVTQNATITDLLCHRIGLGTFSGDVIWYNSDLSTRELISMVRYLPQKYGFRAGYGYSNLMFVTAGEVIKEVAKVPWHTFVRKTFLHPLGMNRTITSVHDLQSKGNFATPHKPVDGQNIPIKWVVWDNIGAAGGIISSAADMSKWLLFQLNHGVWQGDTILSPAMQNILWTPHNNFVVPQHPGSNEAVTHLSGYGLGWGVSDYRGNRMISHGGGYDGMYSRVAMLPDRQIGVVVLTNTMKGISRPLCNDIFDMLLGVGKNNWSAKALAKTSKETNMAKRIRVRKEGRIMHTHPSLPLENYTGIYQSDLLGQITISSEGENFIMQFEHAPMLSAHLSHWHFDTWEILWNQPEAWFDFGTIQFTFDNQMHITGFKFDVPNNDIFFEEVHVRKMH